VAKSTPAVASVSIERINEEMLPRLVGSGVGRTRCAKDMRFLAPVTYRVRWRSLRLLWPVSALYGNRISCHLAHDERRVTMCRLGAMLGIVMSAR
jgi:hypothetical protein